MGVWWLESFTKAEFGVAKLDLKKVVQDASLRYSKPIFVFDGYSLIGLISYGEDRQVENLFGGRHWLCTEFLNEVFTQLKASGAELVFFFDGSPQTDKIPTWISRQYDSYQRCARILDMLRDGNLSLKNVLESGDVKKILQYYKNLYGVVKASCKKFGRVYVSEKNESDQDIASFIQSHIEVIGLFANDSDFMIFPGKFRYFSTYDMSLESGTLTTLEYPREILRVKLKLSDMQMAFFASLCGNDFITHEMRKFQWQIQHQNGNPEQKVKIALRYKIANIVRKYAVFVDNIDNSVNKFMQNVSKKDVNLSNAFKTIEGFKKHLNQSVKFYLKKVQIDLEDLSSAFKETLRYKIDQNITIQNPHSYLIDLKDDNGLKFCHNYQKLLERKIGAIMQLHPASKSRKVHVWNNNKKSHTDQINDIEVLPNFPNFTLSSDFIRDDVENQLKLLKWMSSLDHLAEFDLSQFEDETKIDIITMTSLFDQDLINLDELDILLWTTVACRENLIPRNIPIDKNARINYRAFCITQMFSNLHCYGTTDSAEICGLKCCYAKSINFDGMFFHKEFMRIIFNKESITKLGDSSKKFKQIRDKLHKMIF